MTFRARLRVVDGTESFRDVVALFERRSRRVEIRLRKEPVGLIVETGGCLRRTRLAFDNECEGPEICCRCEHHGHNHRTRMCHTAPPRSDRSPQPASPTTRRANDRLTMPLRVRGARYARAPLTSTVKFWLATDRERPSRLTDCRPLA